MKTVEQRLEEMGLKLSDEDRQVIIRVAKALGLPDNDAMLSIIGALQMYQKLYSAIPQNISVTAAATLEKFKAAADAEALAAHSRAEAALSEKVAKAAQDIANHTARKQQWQWIGVGLVVATVAVVVASWLSFAKGVQTGRAESNAVGTWADTADGRLAYQLWQAGDLRHVAKCDSDGWRRERIEGELRCVPDEVSPGRVMTWRIPK